MAPANDQRRPLAELAALGLALLGTLLAFWPSLSGQFVYDDRILVAQNPTIRSLAGVAGSWSSAYWDFLESDVAVQLGYWRPLTAWTLFAGFLVGGGQPWGFHVVSLALHLCAVAAVFALARRLTRDTACAFFAALLFGLHPVQVEAVAWISAVNDPLYGLFVILGLASFLAWRERGSKGLPLAAAALFALGLMAKENAVAFVGLALALDLGRPPRETDPPRGWSAGLRPWSRAHGTFALVLLAYYGVRVAVFGDLAAGVDRVTTELFLPEGRAASLRVELAGGFLRLLVWPLELDLFRETRAVLPSWDGPFLTAVAWVLGWAGASLWCLWKGRRPLLAGLLIAMAGVAPALLRLESLGRFVLSDRFLYVSVLGAALSLALLARTRLPRALSWGALAALALGLGLRSHARAQDWRDEESLFRSAVVAEPRGVYAHWGLGRVLTERFQATGEIGYLQEALAAFETVQDLVSPPDGSPPDPTLFYTLDDVLQANCGIGWCFLFLALVDPEYGLDEAELVFDATLGRFPDSPEALVGLGVSRMHLGKLDEAREHLTRASEVSSRFQPAWFNLGQLELRAGDFAAAAEHFTRALEIEPDDVQSRLYLGTALVEGGLEPERAREVLEEVAAARPGDAAPRLQLGALAAREGSWREAARQFERALALDRTSGITHLLHAKVLLQLDEKDRAVTALGQACELSPDAFEPHFLLGRILAERGFGETALPYLQRALEIAPRGPYASELRATIEAIEETPR